MPSCKVYGTKPDNGPTELAAQTARNNVNQAHVTWAVVLAYKEDTTTATYTSTVATEEALEEAFTAQFSGYTVVAY